VAVIALLFVAVTGMRPAYDPYGWLEWGRQAWHLSLNTYAAPSWKPLSFLFTFPYALAGPAAVWLWMETAVGFAFAGSVFAGRIAYRLTAIGSTPRYAAIAAAVFAGVAVMGIEGYGHFILIADTDPMIATLCLAAIDLHLSDRPRLAWLALVLAALGRPEVWVVALGYAAWLWLARPTIRRLVVGGILATAALWFIIPGLTSPSWTIAGDIASRASTGISSGSRIGGVLDRFFSLYELPMWLAALAGLILAAIRRELAILILAGAAIVWVAVEVAFAYHGWPASPRYMFEPAAVAVVIAGTGVGRLLALTPEGLTLLGGVRRRMTGSPGRLILRVGGVALVAALFVALAPHARIRARLLHNGIVLGQGWAHQIHRLRGVIDRDGGVHRVLGCGHPVTEISWQSILAWELNVNVAAVNWNPEGPLEHGEPMVLFEPHNKGWIVTPINIPASRVASCRSLGTVTDFG
jgi:hypothetical protein